MHRGAHYRLPRSAFEPLRLRAYLQCGVISDEYLPIDSVLYYHAMRDEYGDQDVTVSGEEHPVRNAAVSLPLLRHEEHGPHWYYAASFARWSQPVANDMSHWNKRVALEHSDLIDFGSRKPRFDVASGRYKSYHMPIFYRHTLYVDWYVVGLRAWIEPILQFCTHLGKKTSQGFGSVARWEVEPWHADWSVRDDAGLLL